MAATTEPGKNKRADEIPEIVSKIPSGFKYRATQELLKVDGESAHNSGGDYSSQLADFCSRGQSSSGETFKDVVLPCSHFVPIDRGSNITSDVDQYKLRHAWYVSDFVGMETSYAGHRILICGYDAGAVEFEFRDPASSREQERISSKSLREARRSFGDDEDLLLIYLRVYWLFRYTFTCHSL